MSLQSKPLHRSFDLFRDRLGKQPILAFLVVVLIATAELLLTNGFPELALWLYLVVLTGCTLVSAYLFEKSLVFTALALLSCFRLLNLGVPSFVGNVLYWLPLVYLPLLPALVVFTRSKDELRVSFSLRRDARLLGPALVVGGVLGSIEYVLVRPEALVSSLSVVELLELAVVMFLVVGLVEEYLFRGVVQQGLQSTFGRWSGIFVTAILFGLMHSAYGFGGPVLFAFAVGILLGIIYDLTESITTVTTIHGTMNIVLFSILPHSTSLAS